VLSISLFLFPALMANGQDIHFSQFYASPLNLNPALTGDFNGNIRLAANHRNQWASVTVPYLSSSFSFDVRNWSDQLNGDAIGLGLLAMHDQSGDGNFTNVKLQGSIAYHKKLEKNVYPAHLPSMRGTGIMIWKAPFSLSDQSEISF